MGDQLLEEITQNVTKNPNWEEYFLQKYFDDVPDNKYHHLHFTEVCETDVNGDDWYSSGVTDKELIEVLLHRIKTDKVCYTKDNSKQTNSCYKELFIKTLELMLLTFK